METKKSYSLENLMTDAAINMPLMASAIYVNHAGIQYKPLHVALEIPFVYGIVHTLEKRFGIHPLGGIGAALALKNLADYACYGDKVNLEMAIGAAAGGALSLLINKAYNKYSKKKVAESHA